MLEQAPSPLSFSSEDGRAACFTTLLGFGCFRTANMRHELKVRRKTECGFPGLRSFATMVSGPLA